MDYYESAEDITISRARALHELRIHGMDDPETVAQFDLDNGGEKHEYDAQSVLAWLGY